MNKFTRKNRKLRDGHFWRKLKYGELPDMFSRRMPCSPETPLPATAIIMAENKRYTVNVALGSADNWGENEIHPP